MKISSKNQKGGITAKNVNIGSGSNQFGLTEEKDKNKKWMKPFIIIGGIVAFIASVIAILTYFDIFV
jgi:hypothetical protein